MAKTYIDLYDIEKMEKVATCLRDKLLIRLPFRLGCRISEALALTVPDIDFNQGTVTILHLKSRIKLACPKCETRLGRSHQFCPGCGENIVKALSKEREHRRIRTIPLDSQSLEILREYVDRSGPVHKNGKLLIFGINRHRAWQIIVGCAKKAGLGKLVNPETGKVHNVSPHRLRDAFAINAIKHDDSGDGLRLLQEHLGHASFNTTAKYRKVAGEEQRQWYDQLWDKQSDNEENM